MENRDNQQENRLWWLGGIIDGEGCITINHHTRRDTLNGLLFQPLIAIVNTNKIIIDTCQSILRENGIPFYVSYKEKNIKNKEKWQIVIVGIKRVSKALTIISPYIIGKNEETSLVKRFCDLRLTKPKEIGSYGNMVNPLYGDEEFNIILKVAEIHNRNPQRLYAEIRRYIEKERPQTIRNRENGRFARQDKV